MMVKAGIEVCIEQTGYRFYPGGAFAGITAYNKYWLVQLRIEWQEMD
ncbi:MAG: hypothetical protein L0Z73_07065 [Gammaproteobacteria bacterium]|nr:hypothetical protein [Gammaproteobacteria bacterium]